MTTTVQFEVYLAEAITSMTQKRAKRVKELRCEVKMSYKDISACSHKEWGRDATWSKAGCKSSGEALCVAAARKLGENPYNQEWS